MAAGGELSAPVAYAGWWLLVAIAMPVLVVAWYAGVSWWARGWQLPSMPPRLRLALTRRRHRRRLEGVATGVTRGEIPPREAHLLVSEIVRSFAADTGRTEAPAMSLSQLRSSGLDPVADVVELTYPPAFAPDVEPLPEERLPEAMDSARVLIRTWQP